MTILPSEAERKALKIDTYERAILYSAILLRESFLIDGEKSNLKRLSITTSDTHINIKGEFPYSNSESWELGGDFQSPVHYLSLLDPSGSLATPSDIFPSYFPPFIPLALEPNWVRTLEEFFVWAVVQARRSLLMESPPILNQITYRYLDKKEPLPVVELEVALPLNISRWLRDRHYFNSLIPLLKINPLTKAISRSAITINLAISSKENILRVYRQRSHSNFKVRFNSSDRYLRVIRDFSKLTLNWRLQTQGFKIYADSSNLNLTFSVSSLHSYQRQSSFNLILRWQTLKSRLNSIRENSTLNFRLTITSQDRVEGKLNIEGGWNARVKISVKPDYIEKDLSEFPVFIHANDLQDIINRHAGNLTEQLTRWSVSDISKSFRVRGETGAFLPVFTAIEGNNLDGNFQNEIRNYESFNGGLWFLAPKVSSENITKFHLYLFDLDYQTGNNGKTYPINRSETFKNYHWVSFAFSDDADEDYPLNVNIANATIQVDDPISIETKDENSTLVGGNTNSHPFTEKNNFTFGDLKTGNIITNPINITQELTTPTLQAWQFRDTIGIFQFDTFSFTAQDKEAPTITESNSRKYSLNKNGGFLNDTFNNPRSISPIPNGFSPEFRINSQHAGLIYVKLCKYHLDFDWIKAEYINEVQRNDFYEIGDLTYFSVIRYKLKITSTHTPPSRYIDKILNLSPLAHYPLIKDSKDVVSGYDFLEFNNSGLNYTTQGLEFTDGSSYLQESGDTLKSISNDFTIICWIKSPNYSGGLMSIVNSRVNGSTGMFFGIDDNKVRAFFNGTGSSVRGNITLNDNTGYYLAFTASSINGTSLYVNGQLDVTNNNTTPISQESNKMTIRREPESNSGKLNKLESGTIIKDLTWFDKVLTDQEILDLYNGGI